jgi:chaperonin GroEL
MVAEKPEEKGDGGMPGGGMPGGMGGMGGMM